MYIYNRMNFETKDGLADFILRGMKYSYIPTLVLEKFPSSAVTVYRRGVLYAVKMAHRTSKIEAIKVLRTLTGMGLLECKEFVESDDFAKYDYMEDKEIGG